MIAGCTSCGSDHTISVYNVRKLREHGKLLQEGGGAALHCLAFFSDTHLVSGGGDGEMCIWRASDWECLLRMKGHKGAIHAIAIHPSGRAALSVAADSKLMLWNLTTARNRRSLNCAQGCLDTRTQAATTTPVQVAQANAHSGPVRITFGPFKNMNRHIILNVSETATGLAARALSIGCSEFKM